MSIGETFEEMFRKRFGRPPTKEDVVSFIDQSVTSHNQSGGITAHTVNMAPQPRRLDEFSKRDLLTMAPRNKTISIIYVMNDREAYQLADEIEKFLKGNGFILSEDGLIASMMLPPPRGVEINPETGSLIVGQNLPR